MSNPKEDLPLDQDHGTGPAALPDLPDLILDKIAGYLSLSDLHSFSLTSLKLFKYSSSQESLWKKKLIEENMDTDSPRLMKKAEDLQMFFPISCHSKRMYLLHQKIRQNFRSGNFTKVSEIITAKYTDYTVVNDDYVVLFSCNGACDVFKVETGRWNRARLVRYPWHILKAFIFGPLVAAVHEREQDSDDNNDDDDAEEDDDGGAEEEDDAVEDYYEEDDAEEDVDDEEVDDEDDDHDDAEAPGLRLVVVNVGGDVPQVQWTRDFDALNDYMLADTKIFCMRTNAGLGFVEELDLSSGATTRMVPIGDYPGRGSFISSNVFVDSWDVRKETRNFININNGAVFTLAGLPKVFVIPDFANARRLIPVSQDAVRVISQHKGQVFVNRVGCVIHIYDVVAINEDSATLRRRRFRLNPNEGDERVVHDGVVDAAFGVDVVSVFGDDDVGVESSDVWSWHFLLVHGVLVWFKTNVGATTAMIQFLDTHNGRVLHKLDTRSKSFPAIRASASVFAIVDDLNVRIFDLTCVD